MEKAEDGQAHVAIGWRDEMILHLLAIPGLICFHLTPTSSCPCPPLHLYIGHLSSSPTPSLPTPPQSCCRVTAQNIDKSLLPIIDAACSPEFFQWFIILLLQTLSSTCSLLCLQYLCMMYRMMWQALIRAFCQRERCNHSRHFLQRDEFKPSNKSGNSCNV